jgi:hypothetical protein
MSMTRRTWLGLSASVAAVAVATTPAAAQQPNIVFVLTDNLGNGELGVYGGGILRGAPAPSLDNLPAKGCACITQ